MEKAFFGFVELLTYCRTGALDNASYDLSFPVEDDVLFSMG